MLKNVVDIREARIKKIKKQIANGTYNVSSETVARAMKRWYLRERNVDKHRK